MAIKNDPASANIKTVAAKILRLRMILTGTVAVFGKSTWTAAKANKSTPKRANRRIIRQLLHAYVEPPHCRAIRRVTMLGTKKKVPRGSRRRICSHTVAGGCGNLEGFRMKMRHTAATAPIGRLI